MASPTEFKAGKISPVNVVGIGGSAGGLDAFRALLGHLPVDSGMAFAIVQHLARGQKSLLPDILSRSTPMPVVELTESTPVVANRVYVMSSSSDLEYVRGAMVTRKRDSERPHLPIDRLFASLAHSFGSSSIGVILSGSDGDGTAGAMHIREAGGVTFAQDASAQFGEMPQSAIEKGLVDFVLSPAEIARKLTELAAPGIVGTKGTAKLPVAELSRIIALLRSAEGVDFLHYKSPTIERRIQRRMMLGGFEDLAAYRRRLEEDVSERQALYRDILIGVTSFFRDPETSATLKKRVFPALIDKAGREPVRFWVPACSTGEEAYSLAILVLEYLQEMNLTRRVQIFGSDINGESVAFARAATYAKTIEGSVSAERLKRFFDPSLGGGYSINKSVRELCVFAQHNLLKDPPFSRLDFISCSNLLIYFQPAEQARVAQRFRYALNGNGLLMLGPSESLQANSDGFIVVDKKRKLYRVAPGSRPRFDLSFGAASASGGAGKPGAWSDPSMKEDPGRIADRLLIERYAHPGLVVNDTGDVIEFRGDMQPFLAPAAGAASFKLSKLLHQDLLVDVRTALFKARHGSASIRREQIELTRGKEKDLVNLEVLTSTSAQGRVYVITFELLGPSAGPAQDGKRHSSGKETESVRLARELASVRHYLTHLTNEHEQSDSIIYATNEELQSANEELQSTIEELETATEELQSTNEELATVNDELRVRNLDLAVLGDDLGNLLASIDTPVIMVDSKLVLRLFNPTAERLFSFRQSDIGRPIEAFNPLMELPDLPGLLRRVIEARTTVDSDVRSRAGHWYSLRVRPYRSSRNQIEGAVITLIDTHDLRSALTSAEASRDAAEGDRSTAEHARHDALEANRLKDDFLSTLSHELRTPMTSILGWAQIMRMTQLDAETMDTAISTIERGTQAQIRLIDDLLDISRITTGRLRLDRRPFFLRALVDETMDVVRPAITAKEIKSRTNLDGGPDVVYGDPDRLRQVIWNLLSNAVKFTPAGGSIAVTISQSDGAAIIRISDTGEGIPSEFLPRVFERFAQGESGSRRAKPGLGLGLAISKYIVDLHGGTIAAESGGPGQGSTFTVTLPLVPATGSESVAERLSPAVPGELPVLVETSVLIVDDDADSVRLMVVALEKCGATVIQASSVKTAMRALKKSSPDVIITDIAMPSEDGIDLLRRVRALPEPKSRVPMLAVTAFTSESDRLRILAAGFTGYMVKPAGPLELMHAVAAATASPE
ncbi:MAG: chemotaxis protein CheB [Acidobacteriota bacterium]